LDLRSRTPDKSLHINQTDLPRRLCQTSRPSPSCGMAGNRMPGLPGSDRPSSADTRRNKCSPGSYSPASDNKTSGHRFPLPCSVSLFRRREAPLTGASSGHSPPRKFQQNTSCQAHWLPPRSEYRSASAVILPHGYAPHTVLPVFRQKSHSRTFSPRRRLRLQSPSGCPCNNECLLHPDNAVLPSPAQTPSHPAQ